MWRGALLVGLLIGSAVANVFSEGGGKAQNVEEPAGVQGGDYEDYASQYNQQQQHKFYDDNSVQEMLDAQWQREQEKQMADEMLRQSQLEDVMAELAKGYDKMKMQMSEDYQAAPADYPVETREAPAQPEEKKEEEKEQQIPKQEEEVDESAEAQATPSVPTMQKKGQSEFVSFIDPEASRLTKSMPSMEKRKLNEVRVERMRNDGSLIYLAVGTVMVVGLVGGLVGGALFYRRRNEEPDDQEYAPYAGTGPRAKKTIKGEKGDDTLAYKAQLHHYQQAKQKIICGEDNAGVAGDSEDDGDDVDDENNFSVYECPGLAPTGDIEVHNPNFAADPAPKQ